MNTDEVMTVLGPVPSADLGVTLPHEHLFNDLSSVVAEPSFDFSRRALVGSPVSADLQWALRHDPYCCEDNVSRKPVASVVEELRRFSELSGQTIVDATGSRAIGRDPLLLRQAAHESGLNIIMSSAPYLEKFEGRRISAQTVDAISKEIVSDLTQGVEETSIRAGVIGEVGVSPDFTAGEHVSLRAAAVAQNDQPWAALNIHMPGWQRRGHEVLDIVLREEGVDPGKVSLAHSDPSGADTDYQKSLLERGVFLEFDMIGLDISFPGEGVSPSPAATADAVAGLIADGWGQQILLSHDLFLKQMWTVNGGNGFTLVPGPFLDMLKARGVTEAQALALLTDNPRRYLRAA